MSSFHRQLHFQSTLYPYLPSSSTNSSQVMPIKNCDVDRVDRSGFNGLEIKIFVFLSLELKLVFIYLQIESSSNKFRNKPS